jgi:hypothetical protein
MTQEEKELVIKDLCSRLPYNCIVSIAEGGIDGLQWDDATLNSYLLHQIMEEDAWEYVKPYLRPLSSMTEEERQEYNDLYYQAPIQRSGGNAYRDTKMVEALHIDWLNKNMFDYRDLIPKGLAETAPEKLK